MTQLQATRAGVGAESGAARARGGLRRVVAPALGVGGVVLVTIMLWHLPRVGGTSWRGIVTVLGDVGPAMLAVLALVWLGGQLGHTLVQVAALPGLGHRRALMLNLASSAVASGLPGGGPLSLAANWAILRSWGFTGSAFSTYTLVTTTTTATGKLVLPVLAAGALLAAGGPVSPMLRGVVLIAAAVLLVGLVMGWLLATVVHRPRAVRSAVLRAIGAIRTSWKRLAAGAGLQLALQYLLFLLCLQTTGSQLGLVAVGVAFAAGRLLSALPLTPGGLGITETGTAALLVVLGADPVSAVAGVVLFSIFVVVLEIPLGALGLLWWRLSTRHALADLP